MTSPLRLLFLEDEPHDVELAVAMLDEAGFECEWTRVDTEAQFSACLDTPSYDVILADYSLPSFDGLTALRHFRARGLNIPFILVSGTMGEEVAIESLKAGATDYVLKGRLARLPLAVRRALLEKQLRDERQQAEAELRKSEERYRALYRDNPAMFFTVDANGIVISVNEFGASQLGYAIDELEGQAVLKVFYEPDRPKVLEQLQLCLRDNQQTHRWQLRKIRKDGSRLWVEEFARAIRGSDGTLSVLVVCQDITERKNAEEQLQARQRFLTVLNDITRVALETPDLNAMLHTVADRAGELLNAEGANIALWDEATGTVTPIAASAPEAHAAWFAAPAEPGAPTLMASVLEAGHALAIADSQNTALFSPDLAARLPFRSLLVLPLIAGQQKLGAVLIGFAQPHVFTSDEVLRGEQAAGLIALAVAKAKLLNELEQRVNERTHELAEANERLKELDRMKDQFIANVTHDLRTPLTSIALYLNMLKKRGAGELHRTLPILQREAQRLTRLIEDLLTLSRLEQNNLVSTREPRVLDSLLDEVLLLHGVRANDKQLLLIHELNPDAPAVPVDYAQMMQVFNNLIGNAVAYTPPGGRIECSVTQARAGYVLVTVANSGPAIPPEDLPHIFERFYRGQIGLQSDETGTGLGLAICREIVERHGGRIDVESSSEQGTLFRVWLPVNAERNVYDQR